MDSRDRIPKHGRLALAAALACAAGGAQAVTIDTGDSGVGLRWDTTLKYTAAFRVRDRDERLVQNPANQNMVNLDDGDRNFGKGLISNRIDLLTEVDATYQNFGARISGAGWYDSVYLGDSDNDSPATRNTLSRPYPQFGDATRSLHGRKGELLDAFLYGKLDLSAESSLAVRAGRHSLQWGESLFFGANGIAGGMAPSDLVKLLSVPNTPFREIVRPVGQVSGLLQLRPNLAIGAYVQYRWEPTRLPGAGSYFSTADLPPSTGEALLPVYGSHAADVRAKDSGQGGVQVRWRPEGSTTDLGFYAIRYHEKVGQQFVTASPQGLPLNYYYAYPEGIRAYGFSATHTFDEFNVGFETSFRRNAPLVSSGSLLIPALGVTTSYARGNTAHVNLNVLASLGPSFIAQESSLSGEIAANYTQSVTEHPESVDANAQRHGLGLRLAYEPTYRQVIPGLDLSVPLGISYAPWGRSSAGGGLGTHHGGDMSIGLNGTYLDVWRLSLSYTHYYGPLGPLLNERTQTSFLQSLKDRDFVSLSIRRAF